MVPQDVTVETSQAFVRDFESWTITNGFRDLVETFSVFLVAVFSIAYILERGTVLKEDHDKAIRKFDRGGVEAQLAALTKTLGLDGRVFTDVCVLEQRAELHGTSPGHRESGRHGPLEEPFVLRWRTRSLMLEDGRDATLALYRDEPLYVEKGEAILYAEVERTTVLASGSKIRLSRHDRSEICYGVIIATECVHEGLTLPL
ncbi:hypothetical protein MESS2_p80009 [Mesorhizobium metallidurans STM 2683]|uniref:Uncharacterized protein n=1 Tax=Mesorhizobium metallidurans STM 2683 TaxID=1297569 RepID=M5FCC0_9HYPH|nr:hypothetical protein [Mesorhizobium metallidurans]CCV09591.1 hypothetical protein MESS2_p80009 [Mesorhizobium metallidurans STM 2683]